nr:hypothetical protein [Pandoravirus aubagnensis]
MQVQRSWSDADAHEASAAFGRLCDRLIHGTPRAGDVSEWARLTLNVPAGDLNDEDDTIDCDALVARYSAFWEALAQKPRLAEIVTGQRWPPSVTDVATLFDSITIPGGIIDVGQGDPMLDLPASLDRRLHRRDLLQTRGSGTVDPAFPDPLPTWKRVLFPDIRNSDGNDDHGSAVLYGAHGDQQGSGGDRRLVSPQTQQHSLCGEAPTTFMPRGGECRDAYFVVITPPSPEPDDEGDGYDMSVNLYQVVGGDGDAYPIAVGIVEWDETNNWMPVGRGDILNSDRAEAVVGESASLLPTFLRRLARNLGAFGPLVNVATDGVASTNVCTTRDNEADRDFDCASGWVAGADEVRDALVQIGSIEGLPEVIAAYEPGLEAPVFATWMDSEQLRLAMSLFVGQRAAKTARAIADADAARSLEGAAAAIYRGPAFAGLLPEAVAHRLAFHRWVRGCAGARDRPLYEEALWHWPEHSSGGDVTIRLDNKPDVRVDPRRTSCGAEAAADILAAAESLGITASAVETQRPRLLCATLARDAIRAGAWAAFGVRPLEPEALVLYADYAELAAQRGPWRRACAGTATLQDMADLVASARDAGLALEDKDLVSPGRLCAKLALFMAV